MSDADGLSAALTKEHREIDSGIEETLLFPPLRAAGLMMPIMVMLREHGVLWTAMEEAVHDDLADFLHSGRTPDGWVCETAGR